jgi:DNA-binding LytR/AlgR family response regulator
MNMDGDTTVRVVIAEDEPAQRTQLERLLAEVWPEAEIVAVCNDGDAALAALENHSPAVMFLDIRMPGRSGLEVARAASGRAQVVLTTAYEEYALQAFEAGALDYLLKPVTRERLSATVERLRDRLKSPPPAIQDLIERLQQQLKPDPAAGAMRWITAACGNEVRMLSIDEVLYFQASDKYVRVVTADSEALVRMSLKELAERLDPERFWPIHRSVIVAVAAIERAERDELGKMQAVIRGRGDRLPIGPASRHLFRGM